MIVNIILFLDSLGGGEMLLIFFVVLLFFGPKSLPGLAKGLGKGMREFRNAMNDVRSEIEDTVNAEAEKKTSAKQGIEAPKISGNDSSDTSNNPVDIIDEAPAYKVPRKVFGEQTTKTKEE